MNKSKLIKFGIFGLIIGSISAMNFVHAQEFPRPCMVMSNQTPIERHHFEDLNTYDVVAKTACNNHLFEGEVEIGQHRPMMFSINSAGQLVKVAIGKSCFYNFSSAEAELQKYKDAGICK